MASVRTLLTAALCLAATAATARNLEPLSKTASDITGRVQLTPTRMVIGKAVFPLAFATGGLRFKDDAAEDVSADLYRVTKPMDPVLRGGNRICGGIAKPTPVRWLLTWHDKDGTVWLSPSSATKQPVDLDMTCGTFSYVGK